MKTLFKIFEHKEVSITDQRTGEDITSVIKVEQDGVFLTELEALVEAETRIEQNPKLKLSVDRLFVKSFSLSSGFTF